jgi:hypothetical protein
MPAATSLIVLLALLGALVLPAPAGAAPGQLALVQDDRLLLNSGPEARELALDEFQALGADAVKLGLPWYAVTPGARAKPPGFVGWNLAAYPDAAWARYDGLVRSARARGLRVLVALSGPAPGWATPARGDARGVVRPSPKEYARWVRAVGQRYSGLHRDASGALLPRVDFWTIWNEPNHPQFLLPLGRSDGRLVAPHHYRDLVRAGVDGLRRSGHARDAILWGELLPIGRGDTGARKTIKPIRFMRELFCLDGSWRPYRGRAARVRGCHRFRRLAGVTGFAYHPYTRRDGPAGLEPTRDDATIRSLYRVKRALDRASARGRLARRAMPVHVTEFGYQSRPPDPDQTLLGRIPAFLAEAERLAWRDGRVRTWSQYQLRDEPPLPAGSGDERYGLFQSGLRFVDGTVKRGVYEAYRSPLWVRVTGRSSVEVWGAARPLPPGGIVQVEERLPTGGYRALPGATIAVGPGGYFRHSLRLSRPASRGLRVTYLDRGILRASRTARASRR